MKCTRDPWLTANRLGLTLALSILPVLLLAALPKPALALEDGNLIEYSYGGFADGDSEGPGLLIGPMLYPPPVKIYQDGRIVFYDEDRFKTGQLEPHQLRWLKRRLERMSLLRESAIVKIEEGDLPGFHGGMAYLRYLDGEKERIVGAFLIPRKGRWARLVRYLGSLRPKRERLFVPTEAEFTVDHGDCEEDGTPSHTLEWPFQSELALTAIESTSGRITVTKANHLSWLASHLEGGFSWLHVDVHASSCDFTLILEEVPGWFEPGSTEFTLGWMARDARMEE